MDSLFDSRLGLALIGILLGFASSTIILSDYERMKNFQPAQPEEVVQKIAPQKTIPKANFWDKLQALFDSSESTAKVPQVATVGATEYHIPPKAVRARTELSLQELREIDTTYRSAEERMLARLERMYGSEIRYWTAAYPGCPWTLPLSLLRNESTGNPYALSRKKAMGLMQLMPSTAVHVGVDDPWDPSQNIYGGVKYACRDVVRAGAKSIGDVAIGYNWGPHRLPKYWQTGYLPGETQVYRQRVLATYRLAQAMFPS